MPINLHLLRNFAAVVEHGSFSRAAAALGVSQPAVSRGLRVLEQEMAVPLLERVGRTVRLTEAGATLHAHAEVIFGAERAALEDLAALQGLEHATLVVGASTTIATYLLPHVLACFQRRHAGVRLRLSSANTREIARLLAAHQLDIALVEGPVHEPHITASAWRTDELVVIAGCAHRLVGRGSVPPSELAGELFLHREAGSGTRDVVERALHRHHVSVGSTEEVGSTEAIKQLVAAGVGISIVSAAAAADQLALGRLEIIRVRGLHIQRSLTRLTVVGRCPSVAARAFSTVLDEFAGDAVLG